ncbi:hypothetical protein DPEC_G00298300 [Dallia pectoralis]|uniref:Uncharacterized protein n=1 Tax=Dallia pectoralis TaxID=75939 RepID=A0ACC2FG08_DALPE|nr:hypothetical protein DPEC_G00298300 [Dallia pectoralis]
MPVCRFPDDDGADHILTTSFMEFVAGLFRQCTASPKSLIQVAYPTRAHVLTGKPIQILWSSRELFESRAQPILLQLVINGVEQSVIRKRPELASRLRA